MRRLGYWWLFAPISGALALGCAKSEGESSADAGGLSRDDAGPEQEGLPAIPDVSVPSTSGVGGAGAMNSDDASLPSADRPLVACASAVADGSQSLIDDFDDHDFLTRSFEGRRGQWFSFGDGTPGGSVEFEMRTVDFEDGMTGALHVTSKDFAEWGSGVGAALRWSEREAFCFYDASVYTGIEFWIRGDGPSPLLTLTSLDVIPREDGGRCTPTTSCYDAHSVEVEVSETWTHHVLPFSAFRQEGWGVAVGALNPSELHAVQIRMGPSQSYDFMIDGLRFTRGDAVVDGDGGSPDAGASTTDAGTNAMDASASTTDAGASPQPKGDGGISPESDAGSQP